MLGTEVLVFLWCLAAKVLKPNRANTSDTKAAFLDLNLSISNDIVSTKI